MPKGGRRWSDKEKEKLKSYWGKFPEKVIAKALGRSVPAIQQQAGKLGIRVSESEPDLELQAKMNAKLEELEATATS